MKPIVDRQPIILKESEKPILDNEKKSLPEFLVQDFYEKPLQSVSIAKA